MQAKAGVSVWDLKEGSHIQIMARDGNDELVASARLIIAPTSNGLCLRLGAVQKATGNYALAGEPGREVFVPFKEIVSVDRS